MEDALALAGRSADEIRENVAPQIPALGFTLWPAAWSLPSLKMGKSPFPWPSAAEGGFPFAPVQTGLFLVEEEACDLA